MTLRIELKRPTKSKPMKESEAPPTSSGPDVAMDADTKAALEREKAEILASLTARVPRPNPTPEPPAEKLEAPVEVPETGLQPVRDERAVDLTASAAADAVAQRQRLETDIKALEAQLAAARQREAAAKHAAVRAQQAQVQAEGSAALSPYVKRLERHRDEVARVQAQFGPILKEAARSCATGTAPERAAKSDAYRAAGLLGARLGDARASIEDAIRRVTLDSQSARPEHHAQAKTLAEAALTLNLITLETDCRTLVEGIRQLNPHLVPTTTPDRMPPYALSEPRGRCDQADLGSSLI